MHEMLHLVFGVMKADNFKAFEKFMNLMMRTDAAKTEYNTLSLTSEYGNLMDLDLQEEVFCRLMEAIISNDRQVGDVFTDG